jgi:hypothetical protein
VHVAPLEVILNLPCFEEVNKLLTSLEEVSCWLCLTIVIFTIATPCLDLLPVKKLSGPLLEGSCAVLKSLKNRISLKSSFHESRAFQ